MKKIQKTLALFLVVLTLFTSISVTMPVFATNDISLVTDENVSEETENMGVAENKSEPEILSEITEKREENRKYFLMSDGTFMVAQYSNSIHYQNDSGQWIDYNNSVTETEATLERTELFGTDELYATSNIADNVVFAEKSNSNTLVSYESKDYPISFNYQSAKKSNINIIENNTELEGDDAFLNLPNVSQELIYEDVFSDVDLQYIVSPSELKENIILKSKAAQNSFTVNYNIGTLTAEVVDSKTINLMAGDEVVYTITAPYMSDANGEKSEKITLAVDKNKNGKLRIDIITDSEWLQDENRAYPVVVDPTITTETTRDAIDSVMIAEGYPNKNYSTQKEMIVGRESSQYGYCRILAKIQLPTLNKGDIIVGAQLNILNYGVWPYAESTPDMQVNAHVLTEDWSVSTVTWNNQPSYNSIVSDYDIFEETDDATWRKFDITKIAKQWYEEPDTNYGIMLKGANTTGTYAENGVKAYMYTERYNDIDDAYPQILLTYRNNKGLEDYWTYTSLSAGAAGSAYINDYTGNLVFATNIISSSNELMPLSVDCVYNGYVSNNKYVSGKNNSNITVPGCGWRLSVQQTVLSSSLYGLVGDAANNYPYVYTDGDGTEHYIYKKTKDNKTTYEDEDGLGLTLTIQKDGSTITGYTITDKKDNKLIFNKQGNLIKTQNANGNYITVNYESTGKKLQSIVDGAGKTYSVTYITDMDYIDYITDPSGRKIDFSYSNGTLINISHPDGTTSNFTYDTADKSMITAEDNDGYRLEFEYTSVEKGKRISTVVEYGNDTEGQKIVFNRSKYNTTTIRTAGNDGVHGNSNDLITTYQFDNFGKTVTQQLKTAAGTDSVAGVYNYTEKDVSSLKTANKVSSSAALGKNVVNYIKGGNAENITNWTLYTNNAVTSTAVSSSDAAYIGQKSIRINNSTVSAVDGNANVYQNISELTGGKNYTLSAYVKTEALVACASDNAGAYVALRFENSDGEYEYKYSEYITENTQTSVNKGWRRLSVSVKLPSDITSVRAYLGLKNYTGKAYFDCIQLEEGSVANDFNLIENSSFEQYTSGLPDIWSASSNISFNQNGDTVYEGISSKYAKEGSKSMVIKGVTDENKNLSQYAYVYGSPNDTYIVSGWARANAVSSASNHEEAKFQITIRIYYDDGNGGTYTEFKTPAKFNTTISDWQYTAQTFTLKSEEHPTYQPKSIRIVPVYYNQVNYAYFDHIQLIKDVAQSYTYDSEGNVVSVSANAEQKDNMEYDDSDLKTYTDVLGNKTTYTYDDKHNVTKAKTPGNVITDFSYNDKGQQTSSVMTNSSGSIAIKSDVSYTNAVSGVKKGAYVKSVSDEHGNETTYDYDYLKGLTKSVTNADNTVTNYEYDNKDRLISVTSEGTAVSYTYSGNKLSTIKYGSDTYSFEYDNYGNIKSTKINGKPLSTNNYGDNNGSLVKTVYGNADERVYTYDSFGNLKTVGNGNNNLYSWSYDSSMTPLVHRDEVNDLEYDYSYDAIGRLIRQDITDIDTQAYIGSTEFTYDLRNNVTKIANEIGGRVVSQSYKYSAISGIDGTERYAKDNLPTRYNITSTRYIDYGYDSINRLNKKTLSTKTPLVSTYSYKMSDRNADDSTLYRTTQISTEYSGKLAYYYTYDTLGNINAVTSAPADGAGNKTANFTAYRSYKYDSLNQLTRENNKTTSETYVYSYDNYGNITSKKTYPYTTGDLGTVKSTVTYTYGTDTDAGWKKLLKSYNGETIDYDAIGNPTTYRGATLTWTGRVLDKYKKGNTTVTYTYDADGLRGSKTVNGEKTTYRYIDGKLLYENRDDKDIFYFYDSYGMLSAIKYYNADGTSYSIYIGTNSLGDIIGIYNSSGELVVKYEYDAWGRVISETDANGNALTGNPKIWSEVNPFRYRGYYYDAETGFYLTGTRYYDPEIGRFINADSVISGTGESVQGYNLFAYCFNNPVNMSDPSGNWPKWATKLVAAVAVVVVVAAVAAVTVATAGAGTAIAAVAVGAAKGAAIGFAVGAASGAAIGYATTGTVEGTLNGMADGALSGSISGAITGGVQGYSNYSNYTSARNFLKNNGQNPDEVMSCFKGTPKVKTLKTDTTVYRTWGGTTQELGHWVSPNNYGSSARNLLSLPKGNTMAHTSSFLLPKGTTVLAGKAAPLFGQSGGGVQWWISVLG